MHTSCRRFNCILNFTAFELCNHRYASFFRLYFAGYTSRDIPNGASAAEFQAALMSITQDQAISSADGGADPVHVTVSLDAVVSPIVAWRVTFLSHLEVTEAESRSGGNARLAFLGYKARKEHSACCWPCVHDALSNRVLDVQISSHRKATYIVPFIPPHHSVVK